MALQAETIKAILNNWDVQKYDGLQDVRPWLAQIEENSQIYGIPETQMTEVAAKSTDGEVNTVLTAMLEAKVAEAGVWPWTDFKESVIQIEEHYRQNMRDEPQDAEDGNFRHDHPYAAAALSVVLIGAGSALAFPAVGVAILGAIGFTSGGVTAGSIAAFLQALVYGGATGGAFSVLQSLAATTVVSPLATLAGAGLAAAGAWLGMNGDAPEVILPDAPEVIILPGSEAM